MSSFNFNAPVTGQIQMSDHTTMNVNAHGVMADSVQQTVQSVPQGDARQTAVVLTPAQRLVEVLARDNPQPLPQAEAVRDELEHGGQRGAAAPDTSRIRQRLELITSGVTAGSGALALVEGIIHAIGD